MRRSFVSFVAAALLAVALVAALGGGASPRLAAQEASPAATPGAAPGVTVEPIGLVGLTPGVAVPASRVTLAPGAVIPPHTSPGPAVARVEAGRVSYVAVAGVARRVRVTVLAPDGTPGTGSPVAGGTPGIDGELGAVATPALAGTPGAATTTAFAVAEETIVVLGEEVPLGPGEGVSFGPDVVHTFRNTGDEPATLVLVGEYPPDQPPFRFVEEGAGATPAGTPPPMSEAMMTPATLPTAEGTPAA